MLQLVFQFGQTLNNALALIPFLLIAASYNRTMNIVDCSCLHA